MALPEDALVAVVVHPGGQPEVAGPDTVFEAGSEVLAVTPPEREGELRRTLTGAH